MLHSNHYDKDQEFRAGRMREVKREHLAEQITLDSEPRFNIEVALFTHRRLLAAAVLVGLLLMIILVLPQATRARDINDTGDLEPFADALAHYRVGHYHFITGDYDQAIENYIGAIDGIPEAMFAHSAQYALIYWDLGEAQLMAGQYNDALTSYQQYLELVGDDVGEQVVIYVQQVQASVENGKVTEVSLIAG